MSQIKPKTELVEKDTTFAARSKAQQKRSRETREHILKTTLELLANVSADGISTNSIAKEAGISVGTLYHYFPNKEAVYYELFEDWLKRTLQALDEVLTGISEETELPQLLRRVLERLSDPDDLNSKGYWRLRIAINATEKLYELDANHQHQVLGRIVKLQAHFNNQPRPGLELPLAYLQYQTTLACLGSLALAENEQQRKVGQIWCEKLLQAACELGRVELENF